VPTATSTPSPRRTELLEAAYAYVLEHGLAEISLRPLASAIGSSPRVLLYLFRSKDGLVRALLARARADELEGIARLRQPDVGVGLRERLTELWSWLEAPGHRTLLVLWTEAYARSLVEPDGPWAGFARQTVEDWLALIAEPAAGLDQSERTLALAVLRGALLDLLASGDRDRTGAAVRHFFALLDRARTS
jgi:AcrR family transcriptional regulator